MYITLYYIIQNSIIISIYINHIMSCQQVGPGWFFSAKMNRYNFWYSSRTPQNSEVPWKSNPAAVHDAHAQVKPKVFSFSWKKASIFLLLGKTYDMMAIRIIYYIVTMGFQWFGNNTKGISSIDMSFPQHPCMVYSPTYIYKHHKNPPNVGKYTIIYHNIRWYGIALEWDFLCIPMHGVIRIGYLLVFHQILVVEFTSFQRNNSNISAARKMHVTTKWHQ